LLNLLQVTVPFDADVNFNSLSTERVLWCLLYFAGYVTGYLADPAVLLPGAEPPLLVARYPNEEVSQELRRVWIDFFESAQVGRLRDPALAAALIGDASSFESKLRDIAAGVFRYSLSFASASPLGLIARSYHDTARLAESWYHAFFLATVLPLERVGYTILSNLEAGYGRADLILAHREKPCVIFEFKAAKVWPSVPSLRLTGRRTRTGPTMSSADLWLRRLLDRSRRKPTCSAVADTPTVPFCTELGCSGSLWLSSSVTYPSVHMVRDDPYSLD
jgi:PD-(D/E)XK nuclease superfamily